MTSAAAETLRRSPLHDRHIAAGGRMVPFAGWEMPVQYAGVREEHLAVRRAAGMFDVSHMGQIETRGPQAQALLQHLVTADLRRLSEGGAQYGLICRPDGGVLDDLISYRLADCHYLTVTNAANHERDLAWFQRHAADFDADVIDRRDDFAMIAVQGPQARGLLAGLADGPLPPRMHCAERTLAGVTVLMCGTGYTGEDGAELICDPAQAPALWDALLAAGVTPAGLGARDTLRTEACFPLYGNELTETRTPIAAGLGWACREETGFIGSDAVAADRARGPAERLAAFVIDGPGIARAGNAVAGGGIVTSGTYAPCLARGAGMAYLPGGAEPGTRLQIDVRGTLRDALVVPKPLYVKES
ncbi:MAG TPA: glycine cleavage system aminomethyltransferase GcvT [Solirubrobacteraceae bacterium]|nr:glycine cleavage system aminomethyltransferase GcvT [Solirubrobacteraceae bacterium]